MARKRIDPPDAHDGLIDRSPSMLPMRRQPHFNLHALLPYEPKVSTPEPLPEDADREQIADAVLAERQERRERTRSWLDVACARRTGFARQELAYAQASAAKILTTLFRNHPEVMAPWAHDRALFGQLDIKGWDAWTMADLHLKRCPHDAKKLTEVDCRRGMAP